VSNNIPKTDTNPRNHGKKNTGTPDFFQGNPWVLLPKWTSG
jgi:hypothetical protein